MPRARRRVSLVAALAVALGGVVLWSSPASATTSCSVASGTATVALDSDAAGGVTTLSQDAAGRLVVDGDVCGESFPTVIDLEVASGAAAQEVRLDQNGAGGVFPCSAAIVGDLRSSDAVEVDGGPGESLTAGNVGTGAGVDLGSCGNPGTITGVGLIRLVAGSGAVTLSAMGNGPGFTGRLGIADVLEAADGSSQTFEPGAAGNTIDFSRVSSPMTVDVSGSPVGGTANQTASAASGGVYNFTLFGSQPISFIGSSAAPTTYDAGSVADSYAGGDPGNDILDFSHAAGGSLRLCVAAVSDCAAGAAQLGASRETFSGIAHFVGLPGGNTTFVSSGAGAHQFTGLGAGNVVDATPAGAGAFVDAVNRLVTAAGSTTPDEFSGVSSFVGASAGGTTFVAGGTTATFADPGAAPGDAIDFSHVPASAAGLTVNVSGGSAGSLGNDTATAGGATYTFVDGGAGISSLTGAATGNTTFDVGPTGGYTLIGQGSGNQVSAAAVPSPVTIDASSGTISGLPAGGPDTVTGLSSFTTYVGTNAGRTTFVAGANDANFVAAGGPNTVDFSHLTNPVAVNVSGTTVGTTSTGSASSGGHTYSFTSVAADAATFVGSRLAATTFDAGPVADSYIGGGTGGDTLDFSHVGAGGVLDLCVVDGSGCTAGHAALGAINESFSGISNFVGLATGNTYFAAGDNPGYAFTGSGAGNLLDLRAATLPSVDVADGLVTGLAGSGHDTFAGIRQFDVGLHAQSAPPADASVGGSYDPVIDGTGSSNQVELSVDPSTTNGACSLDGSDTVLFAHVGTCVLDANQQGDAQFATAAQLTQSFPVAQGATRTNVSVSPSVLTATVVPVGPHAPVATGTVTFTVDGADLGSQQLNAEGVATLTYTVPAGSPHVVVATYSGDADLTGSTGTVDRDDPTVTAHLSSAHAVTTYGWYRSPVTVSFTCTPHGAPLIGTCPSPVLLSHDGAGQSASGAVDAEDGGHGTVTATGIDIDQVAPVVSVRGVTAHAHYAAFAPKASCAGVDALSGSLGCSVQSTTKATASGWAVSYTAAASDRAGNVGRASGSYTVTKYGLSGGTYSHGYWLVRLGHRYAVVAVSRVKPSLVGPVPGDNKPAGRPAAFHRDGTVHGLPVWSATIEIGAAMARHPIWSYGVDLGRATQVVRVRLG